MYCKNCGHQIDDKAVICPHCGVPTDNYVYIQQPQYQPQPKGQSGIVLAAKIFIILGFVAFGIFALIMLGSIFITCISIFSISTWESFIYLFIALLSCGAGSVGVVFGVKALNCMSRKVKPSVAVCVCVLIFCNIVAGILLLCTKNEDY